MVLSCKDYIEECTTSSLSDEDLLWARVQEEIDERGDASDTNTKTSAVLPLTRINTRLTV